jgi:LysR family glycine cleavage system transcriptional activator
MPLDGFEDIAGHTLLCHNSSAGMWDQWLALAGVPKEKQPRRIRFDKLYVALQAANDGLGIVLAPLQVLTNDIARGRLVIPFSRPAIPCHPVEILHPSRQNANHRTRAFVAWFFEQAAAGSQQVAGLGG